MSREESGTFYGMLQVSDELWEPCFNFHSMVKAPSGKALFLDTESIDDLSAALDVVYPSPDPLLSQYVIDHNYRYDNKKNARHCSVTVLPELRLMVRSLCEDDLMTIANTLRQHGPARTQSPLQLYYDTRYSLARFGIVGQAYDTNNVPFEQKAYEPPSAAYVVLRYDQPTAAAIVAAYEKRRDAEARRQRRRKASPKIYIRAYEFASAASYLRIYSDPYVGAGFRGSGFHSSLGHTRAVVSIFEFLSAAKLFCLIFGYPSLLRVPEVQRLVIRWRTQGKATTDRDWWFGRREREKCSEADGTIGLVHAADFLSAAAKRRRLGKPLFVCPTSGAREFPKRLIRAENFAGCPVTVFERKNAARVRRAQLAAAKKAKKAKSRRK